MMSTSSAFARSLSKVITIPSARLGATTCTTTMKQAARSFSSECAPAQKLRGALEEYRQEHFSRELPSRFRKEAIKVIQGPDNKVTIDSFNILLANIGRKDAYLTESELNDLLSTVGATNRRIPVEKAMLLM